MSSKQWFPLESNPEVMNKYMKSLGVEGTGVQFCDVFGMDEELLQMVPQPCRSVLFLFPLTTNNMAWSDKQVEAQQAAGTTGDGVFFCRQTIGNACGTIGIVHSLANNTEHLTLSGDGFIGNFIAKTKGMSADERAEVLQEDETLDAAQEEAAQEGQSANQDINADINLHFIAYVHKNGRLWELDGRKPFPLDCGPSTDASVLQDTAKYVKKYMELDPDEMNFTLVALSSV